MLQKKTTTQSWGIGLKPEQAAFLRRALGREHELVLLPSGSLSGSLNGADDTSLLDSSQPFVLWMSSACAKELEQASDAVVQHLAAAPKVLLLDSGYSLEDFESADDYGFTDILRPALSRERVADIMRRSLETHALHHDMECMTREILLERELLERKNEILEFLVGFLANATESLDLTYLLQTAYSGLKKLLPVRAMHAVLWEHSEECSPLLSLHICAPEGSSAHQAWRETLLEHARHMIGPAFAVTEISRLHLQDQSKQWAARLPDEKNILALPLICGSEHLGVLMLVTSMERHLGRDQALALDSAIRHFALSLKNAQRFRQMQMFADYDALTKVHCRRHFETRLNEEVERLTRYDESVSMIMLDIDNFKQINDTHGHHIGDIVLREVASIMAQTIRATDYCARYGGEEFVILLPHTEHKKATALAKRIRKKIAAHTFLVDGGAPLHLTASLGLSSMSSRSMKNKQALICEADAALYAAKKSGKNCVIISRQADGAVQQKNAC